jgi:hypothetical protein
MAVSRFLKSPIQNESAELKSYPKSLHTRAHLCIYVGGYMREQKEKAKDEKSSQTKVASQVPLCCLSAVYRSIRYPKNGLKSKLYCSRPSKEGYAPLNKRPCSGGLSGIRPGHLSGRTKRSLWLLCLCSCCVASAWFPTVTRGSAVSDTSLHVCYAYLW